MDIFVLGAELCRCVFNLKQESRERKEVFLHTCSDIVVYPLYGHSGICNGIPLLVLHNASDATMHLVGENNNNVCRRKW